MIQDMSYTPGGQLAAISARGVAYFAPEMGREVVSDLWRQLNQGADVTQLLQIITGVWNQQLSSIPSFVIALFDETSVQLVVRGELMVAVTSNDGVTNVSGTGVSTWAERRIERPWSVLIGATGGASDLSGGFPLTSGVVGCSAIEIVASHAGDAAVPSSPVPGSMSHAPEVDHSIANGDTQISSGVRASSASDSSQNIPKSTVVPPVPSEISQPIVSAPNAKMMIDSAPGGAEHQISGPPAIEQTRVEEPESSIPETTIPPSIDIHNGGIAQYVAPQESQVIPAQTPPPPPSATRIAPVSPVQAAPHSVPTVQDAAAPPHAVVPPMQQAPQAPVVNISPLPAAPPASRTPEVNAAATATPGLHRASTEGGGIDYDFLWGATIPRTVEEAAVRIEEDNESQGDESEDGASGAAASSPNQGSPAKEDPQLGAGSSQMIDSVPARFFDTGDSARLAPGAPAPPMGAVGPVLDRIDPAFNDPSQRQDLQSSIGHSGPAVPISRSGLHPAGQDHSAGPNGGASAGMTKADVTRDDPGIGSSSPVYPYLGGSQLAAARGDYPGSGYSTPEFVGTAMNQSGPQGLMTNLGGGAGGAQAPSATPTPPPVAGEAGIGAKISRPEGVSPLRVLAALCSQSHPNPPHSVACRYCREPLVEQPVLIDRPSLGRMQISTGGTIELDRSAIIGRRPKALRIQGDALPTLVTVPSPQQDISRNHLEIRLEGWHVLAADLDSKNGTTLIRQGQAPVLLQPSEPLLVRHGDVLDLGDGVMVLFEDIA